MHAQTHTDTNGLSQYCSQRPFAECEVRNRSVGKAALRCGHLRKHGDTDAYPSQPGSLSTARAWEAHRGVGCMPEEANHLGVSGGADQGHVAVSEGAIDLQVEARLGGWVSVLTEGLHSVSRQVKVEAVGTDLRGGYLRWGETGRGRRERQRRHWIKSLQI